ncbi:MAG: phage tail protein [Acidobacteriota bacterium]|nr:phage tail protein [Acidobacteriota bacterium]
MKKRKPLYELLPAFMRMQDHEEGKPLEAMLSVFESQLDDIQEDLEQLYKNWFIETCPSWVIPYIGDLLGVRNMGAQPEVLARLRPFVGNTLYLRRGKGTIRALEEAVRAVSGWGVKAVPFFKKIACTVNMNHVASARETTLDLREMRALNDIGSPFDSSGHLVDVRHPSGGSNYKTGLRGHSGRYHPDHLGIYLWRLMVFPYIRVQIRPLNDRVDRYTFDPGGRDMPLFNRGEGGSFLEFNYEDPSQVPGPVDRDWLNLALLYYQRVQMEGTIEERDMVSNPLPFDILLDEKPMPATEVIIADLSNWDEDDEWPYESWASCAVDPTSGRLRLAPRLSPGRVHVNYMSGFAGMVGAGSYDRRAENHSKEDQEWLCVVSQRLPHDPDAPIPHFNNLYDAFQAWKAAGSKGMIRILDNGLYQGPTELTFTDREHLIVEAANGMRPCIVWNLELILDDASATIELNGLLIDGGFKIHGYSKPGADCMLKLTHCTFIPRSDEPSITIHSQAQKSLETTVPNMFAGMANAMTLMLAQTFKDSDSAMLRIEVIMKHCITGSLNFFAEIAGITLDTCIVDAVDQEYAISGVESDYHLSRSKQLSMLSGKPIPPVYTIGNMQHTTVLGKVTFHEMERAIGCIFRDPLVVMQRFGGVIRYCYLPFLGSQIQDTHFCQPSAGIAAAGDEQGRSEALRRIWPRFRSTRYGQPGYCRLEAGTCDEIFKGSEDGAEMGVFHDLQEPQVMANLRTVLDEYVHFGLEPDLHFLT